MHARLMYMEDPGPNWRDWVVIFYVRQNRARSVTSLSTPPVSRAIPALFYVEYEHV
jgi:hypothetical protein